LAHHGEALSKRRAFERWAVDHQDSLIEFLKTLQVLPPGTTHLIVDERGPAKRWAPTGQGVPRIVRRRCFRIAVGLTLWLAISSRPASAQTPLLPARGAASAPVVVLLFSDFQCPYCARVEPILKGVREQFPKDVQVVFKHNPLPIHAQAPLAHEAAIEAGRQGKFWEMHDLLFANQQRLRRDDLVAHARQLGLDVPAFTRAVDAHTHRPVVERDMAEARALGVTGTPAVFINGRRLMGVPSPAAVIGLVRGQLGGGDGTESPAVSANTFDLKGSPVRGPANAAVTIVEFSDFQCSYCARASGTVARVLAQYPGKVRWVFKHYPLEFHADAPLAHRATLAAHQQGKFWELHDAIFANQRALKRDDLLKHAATLGLDVARFTADLDGDRFKPILARDMAEGTKVGVDGTPTFFIEGQRLVGAQPYEAFVAAIDKALGAKTAPVAEDRDLALAKPFMRASR
jgi:protein-disulfide isomerase